MPIYEVIERSVERGGLYVRAKFWRSAAERTAGSTPHTESFQWFGIPKTRRQIRFDVDDRPQLLSGEFVDPGSRTNDDLSLYAHDVVTVNLAAIVEEKLAAYARGLDYDARGTDRSELRYRRSTRREDDADGVLDRTTTVRTVREV